MQQTVQRISRLLTSFFAGGAAFSMLVVFLITFINSIRRYAIGKSLEWGEEMPVFIAVYGVMFGIAYAYMQDRHVRFTMLVGFLPKKAVHYLYIFVDALMIVIGITLARSGWMFMLKRGGIELSGLIGTAKALSASTGIEWIASLGLSGPYQFAMVLGGVFLAISALVKMFERILTPADAEAMEG